MSLQKKLHGKKIAILATDGFEESELSSPKQALEDAGARTEIISLQKGKIRGWKDGNWSKSFKVDATVNTASEDDYDALVLPGGVINPDSLRVEESAIKFVQDFFKAHKPVAAICHGPQILIDAKVLTNRNVTSYKSIKRDLENAGAKWSDSSVVCDSGLVTSRTPADLKSFNKKLIEEISEGIH